jgi:hypothetical protein
MKMPDNPLGKSWFDVLLRRFIEDILLDELLQ